MPERWPVVITDSDGDWILVDPDYPRGEPGRIFINTSPAGVALSAAQREELARAIVAASHEADHQARPVPP